jgi:hypothetical protein
MKKSDLRRSLGTPVVDEATGLKGTMSAYASYMGGAAQVQISGMDKNGNPISHWADAGSVESVG